MYTPTPGATAGLPSSAIQFGYSLLDKPAVAPYAVHPFFRGLWRIEISLDANGTFRANVVFDDTLWQGGLPCRIKTPVTVLRTHRTYKRR